VRAGASARRRKLELVEEMTFLHGDAQMEFLDIPRFSALMEIAISFATILLPAAGLLSLIAVRVLLYHVDCKCSTKINIHNA